MQIEKLSETLHKFTLSQNDFSINLVASTGSNGTLFVDTGWEATAEASSELDEGLSKLIIFMPPLACC